MTTAQPLTADQLYQPCDPAQFAFETTDDPPDFLEVIGQPRAVEALRFGIGIRQEGYNIFALGPVGTGKHSLVMQYFDQQARTEPAPPDWCYVHNFEQDFKPNAILLPAGMGAIFQQDMAELIEELRTTLIAAFESDEYRARRRVIEEEFQEREEKAFEQIRQQAQQLDIALLRAPSGLIFAPIRNGEVLPPEEFQKLSPAEQQRLEVVIGDLQTRLQRILQGMPAWQRELRVRMRDLSRETTTIAVDGLISELRQKYAQHSEIATYLAAVQKDVVENARDFLPGEESSPEEAQNHLAALFARARQGQSPLRRYQVNLLVDNRSLSGAPVVHEDNPSYQNLIGRIDHIAQFGALTTDFTLIKPGALHKANGGYLILDARKVLQQPFTWETLKRVLQSRQIKVDSLTQSLSLVSTVSLEPEPIPIQVKVALIGDRMLFYLLHSLDPDFAELFKVQADFEEVLSRNPENQDLYARLVATLVRKNALIPFDRQAVARVIEQSARLIGDAEKVSIQFKDIVDLLREASYWAGQAGEQVVRADHVQKAIDARTYRADRLRERSHESILRDLVLISTKGMEVGQVNGLSVLQLPNHAFAIPSRITARISLGKGDVVNIEREVELSGPIHSKGVLILAGFLRGRFAVEYPLSLSASLVFEQSYSGVEGDSASSAELYALLSAIADVPIRQSLAVTGSVNQRGEVQAIGGVNEKIEGYFAICQQRRLSGDQGVLIPASNIRHLMLSREVRDAVAAGQFSIYPIENIDQGIEILTFLPAGEPDENGHYPENSINGRVQARLEKLAKQTELLKKSQQGGKEGEP